MRTKEDDRGRLAPESKVVQERVDPVQEPHSQRLGKTLGREILVASAHSGDVC